MPDTSSGQRRYTEEQKTRILESGEKPPEGISLPSRVARNAAVSVPRQFTDLLTLGGMIVPAIQAGASDEVDLPEAMYGKEGLVELQDYISNQTNKELAKLPQSRRTDRNIDTIRNAIANSGEAEEIRLRVGPALVRYGTESGNYVNSLAGLNPVREETIVDDASQIVASALLPTGGLTRALTKAAEKSVAAKMAKIGADVLMPGTTRYTPAGVAANTALPLGGSQVLRAVTDQPSVITGDALGPEFAVTAATPVDSDPESGMGGEQLAATVSGVGGLAVAAAVLAGKANKVATKAVLDSIDETVEPPEFKPSLTKSQRLKSEAVDSSSPLRDTIENAYDPNSVEKQNVVDEITRHVTNTANVNLNTAHVNAMDLGVLPGLDRKTVPLRKIQRAMQEFSPEELEVFDKGMIAKTMLDEHSLKLKNAEDELRDAKMGLSGGRNSMAEVKAIQSKTQGLRSEDASLNPSMSVKEGREFAAALDSSPKMAKIESALRQLSSDILDAKVMDGQMTKEKADRLRGAHPNYMMLQENQQAGMTEMAKWWDSIKHSAKGTEEKMWGKIRGPVLERSKDADVVNPKGALDSYKQYLYDHIQYTKQNAATRLYTNSLKDTSAWGRSIRPIDSMTLDEFRQKGLPKKAEGNKNVFAYTDEGKIHFMEAADPEVVRALQFNAPATAMVGNMMRKWSQQGTTGVLAPAFAPKAALFEDAIARTTRKPGRSYGVIDSTLRRMFPNSDALSKILDLGGGTPFLPINTSQLQMIHAVFQQIGMRDIESAALRISGDLENQSGFFNLLAKIPGGKATLTKASEAMLRSFNDSTYGAFVREGIKQSNLLDDPLKQVREGYTAVNFAAKARQPLAHMFKQYMNVLEAVHNSSKYAFFAQNYAAIRRKYGGVAPQHEIDKLVGETRSLSGDMTRAVGNPYFSKVLSTVPYAQVAVNSTYHLASALKHDSGRVGTRLLMGTIAPKLAAVGLISSIPGVAEWYWDDIPTWQRMSTMPVLGPDWWMDFVTGNYRAATPNDIYLMPEAPETTMLSNSMVTFFRALGVFGPDQEAKSSFLKEFGEGLESVTSVATPPIVGLVASGLKIDIGRIITSPLTGKPITEEAYLENPHQGMNTTGINADSDMSRGWANAIGAVFGVAAQNMLNSADVGIQSLQDGDGFVKALDKAFEYSTYQAERRLPEIPGTREAGAYFYTNGQRRQYASTQRRDRINEVMDKFEPINRQLSDDNDRSGANRRAEQAGLDPSQHISDPQVRSMAQTMHKMLSAGAMERLSDKRVDLNKDLVRIEANKENMNPRTYHMSHTGIMEKMNEVNKGQEEVIERLENHLLTRYGVDFDQAIDVIEQSLSQ